MLCLVEEGRGEIALRQVGEDDDDGLAGEFGQIGEPQPVIISEGGIDFQYPTPIAVGAHLSVKLVLMPQALGLLLRARVTHCDRKAGAFDVGTEFERPTDAQRQLLARYILQKQAQERRLARENESGI